MCGTHILFAILVDIMKLFSRRFKQKELKNFIQTVWKGWSGSCSKEGDRRMLAGADKTATGIGSSRLRKVAKNKTWQNACQNSSRLPDSNSQVVCSAGKVSLFSQYRLCYMVKSVYARNMNYLMSCTNLNVIRLGLFCETVRWKVCLMSLIRRILIF